MRFVYFHDEPWRKSSYSAANGDCVEVGQLAGGRIGVRDSKNGAQPALGLPAAAWRTFVGAVKRDVLGRA